MKVKTSELIGPALDWVVAKCEGRKPSCYTGTVRATAHPDFPDSPPIFGPELNYSTDWAQGGPIIEREGINLSAYQLDENGNENEGWQAWPNYGMSDWYMTGPTPLIAAMRCYVASQLGDEVEIPEELM